MDVLVRRSVQRKKKIGSPFVVFWRHAQPLARNLPNWEITGKKGAKQGNGVFHVGVGAIRAASSQEKEKKIKAWKKAPSAEITSWQFGNGNRTHRAPCRL
jgi:hypothetical protein